MTKKTTAEMFPRLLERKKLKEQAAAKAAASTIDDKDEMHSEDGYPADYVTVTAEDREVGLSIARQESELPHDSSEPWEREDDQEAAYDEGDYEAEYDEDDEEGEVEYDGEVEGEYDCDDGDGESDGDYDDCDKGDDDGEGDCDDGDDGEDGDGDHEEADEYHDIQNDNEFANVEEHPSSQDELYEQAAAHLDEQHVPEISPTSTANKPSSAVTTGANQQRRSYPVDAFGKFAAVIKLIASAVQVDLEMVGSSLLGVIAALAQGLINVSSRANDSGCPVTLNLFVIAPSGERKSSTIEKIIKPVYDAIRRAQDERKYMIVQDVTVDGLIVGLIARCPVQFCLVLEGASLLGGHAMSRDNLSRFLGNVASLYSGEPISRTRVNEHHYAQDRRLNVLLFTQPIVAMEFLSSEMVMQQGMGNRFLYSQPSSLLGQRQHTDIELEDNPAYQKFCAKIAELASTTWKINPESGGITSRTVRMTSGAKAAWVDLYNELEIAAGPGGKLAPHAGYVTRFPEQVMRIAALLAMLEDPTVQHISEDIMVRAIELGKYYLESAMRVFDLTPANKDEADAKTLLNWMQNKADEQGMEAIPVRMMYKDGPRCARPSKRTKELLSILAARGEVVEFDEAIYYDKKNSFDNYAIVSA